MTNRGVHWWRRDHQSRMFSAALRMPCGTDSPASTLQWLDLCLNLLFRMTVLIPPTSNLRPLIPVR